MNLDGQMLLNEFNKVKINQPLPENNQRIYLILKHLIHIALFLMGFTIINQVNK